MTRRDAVGMVAALAAFIYGRPTVTAQGRVLNLILDGTDGVLVSYRGQHVVVRPQEIIEALQQGERLK